MSRRRRFTAAHREGLRVVTRLVRDAVYEMQSPGDFGSVLTVLTEGLRALRIVYDGCGIYVVDPQADPPAVTGQHLLRDGHWRQGLPAHDRDAAIEIWREGITTYVEDVQRDTPDLESRLHLRFGHEVRSVVDVPFSHGVLTLARRRPEAFGTRDIEMLRDLAEGLPALFQRMQDLRELELRDRLLERAQRLQMIGQLAAGTVHEVNNALTAMLGHCELLLMDEVDTATRESLEMILRAGDSAHMMVGHFLQLARGNDPEPQVVDLNQLVHDALQLLRRQLARDQVDLVEQFDRHLSPIAVQAGQVQQVILNLVQNARDAVLAHGNEGRITVRSWADGGRVCLSVEDDGPGIPRDLRERVFEPFFTTKDSGKGTGLGLSVCRTIAASHGGDLRYEPPEQGSRFVLVLPAADMAAKTALN